MKREERTRERLGADVYNRLQPGAVQEEEPSRALQVLINSVKVQFQ